MEDAGELKRRRSRHGHIFFGLGPTHSSPSPLLFSVFRYSPSRSRRFSHSTRRALIHCSALLSTCGSMAQVRTRPTFSDRTRPASSSTRGAASPQAATSGRVERAHSPEPVHASAALPSLGAPGRRGHGRGGRGRDRAWANDSLGQDMLSGPKFCPRHRSGYDQDTAERVVQHDTRTRSTDTPQQAWPRR